MVLFKSLLFVFDYEFWKNKIKMLIVLGRLIRWKKN
jgi:hypothetical protein